MAPLAPALRIARVELKGGLTGRGNPEWYSDHGGRGQDAPDRDTVYTPELTGKNGGPTISWHAEANQV